MRVGSIVMTQECCGRIQLGTVIATHEVEDDYVNAVDVRWEDGEVELRVRVEDIDDITPTTYVNLYLKERCYGGAEEGGWHFDQLTPLATDDIDYCEVEPTMPQGFIGADAENVYETWLQWCESENAHRRPLHSVLSNGIFVVELEAWPAEPHPKHKPMYG